MPPDFNSTDMETKYVADSLLINKQAQFDWRIGTGFNDKGDPKAYLAASNRTYLMATAWGYSAQFASKNSASISNYSPNVTLTCLSPLAGTVGLDHDDSSTTSTASSPKESSSSTSTTSSPKTSSSSSGSSRRYAAMRFPWL